MNMRWSARDIPIERKNNQNCVAPLPTIAKLYVMLRQDNVAIECLFNR